MQRKSFMEFTLDRRQKMSSDELRKYPDAVPMVIIYYREWKDYKDRKPSQPFHFTRLKRFSVTKTAKVFLAVANIQNTWKLTDKGSGIFVYSLQDQKMVNLNATMGEIYEKCKSEDGWLYLLYDTQPIF